MIDYASTLADPELVRLWTPATQVRLERNLWCMILEEQLRVRPDLATPQQVSDAWLAAVVPAHLEKETLERINRRELTTRHDLKARLEIFCEDAGHERLHLGCTSADIVENITQIRIRESLVILLQRHGGWLPLEGFVQRYPFRGVTGPMGTAQDQLELLGNIEAVQNMNERLARRCGFLRLLDSAGQVVPRSLDSEWSMYMLSWVTERTGRHQPWRAAVAGYGLMLAAISGDQWNEGDVSTSVVRRVAVPGLLLAADIALKEAH